MELRRNTLVARGARGRGARAGGFTLIEVLVTIAVLLVMLPAIVGGFKQAADIARLTRQRAEATALAQSKMDEMVATGLWQQGGTRGEETYRATVYTWEASLSNWEEADVHPLLNLQRLDVTVSWTFRSTDVPQKVQLTTVVYLPDTTTQTVAKTPGGKLQ